MPGTPRTGRRACTPTRWRSTGCWTSCASGYPRLEIESCAGGGGRIDLGILERTDRVWPSDCIDALERQQIQRYTQLLLPPELMGTHIGSAGVAHHAAAAQPDLPGDHGAVGAPRDRVGPDRRSDAEELAELGRWVALHKRLRGLLHSGTVVNVDHPDPAIALHGVVAGDQREAIFAVTALARSTDLAAGAGPVARAGPRPPLRRARRAGPGPAPPHPTAAAVDDGRGHAAGPGAGDDRAGARPAAPRAVLPDPAAGGLTAPCPCYSVASSASRRARSSTTSCRTAGSLSLAP